MKPEAVGIIALPLEFFARSIGHLEDYVRRRPNRKHICHSEIYSARKSDKKGIRLSGAFLESTNRAYYFREGYIYLWFPTSLPPSLKLWRDEKATSGKLASASHMPLYSMFSDKNVKLNHEWHNHHEGHEEHEV